MCYYIKHLESATSRTAWRLLRANKSKFIPKELNVWKFITICSFQGICWEKNTKCFFFSKRWRCTLIRMVFSWERASGYIISTKTSLRNHHQFAFIYSENARISMPWKSLTPLPQPMMIWMYCFLISNYSSLFFSSSHTWSGFSCSFQYNISA